MFIGFRIWYADGTVKSSLDGDWAVLPYKDVQFVTFYEERTYRTWIDDHWETENYLLSFSRGDYYWYRNGEPGAGMLSDVPSDLPDELLKVGSTIPDDQFWQLVVDAQEMRIAP